MPKRPNNPGDAWCSQHECHLNDCFSIHNPTSSGASTEAEHRQAILRAHIEKQNENIRLRQERMSRSVVDARQRFEDNKRKGA